MADWEDAPSTGKVGEWENAPTKATPRIEANQPTTGINAWDANLGGQKMPRDQAELTLPPEARGIGGRNIGTQGPDFDTLPNPKEIAERKDARAKELAAKGLDPAKDPEWVKLSQQQSQIESGIASAGAALLAPIGGAAAPAARAALTGAGKAAQVGGQIARDIAPGAMERAQGAVRNIGPVRDVSDLGNKMYGVMKDRVNQLTKVRREEASNLKRAYFAEAAPKEQDIANAYIKAIGDLKATKLRSLSNSQRSMMENTLHEIGSDPSIERLEIERRRLMDIASGRTEGFDSIQAQFAGDLAHMLKKAITDAVPEADTFLTKYAEMSDPINQFNTRLGRKITKGANEWLPDVPANDVANIPGSFFKTKQSVRELYELSGRDQKFVEGAGGEYVASTLRGKSADQARAWLDNPQTRDWLNELPSVRRAAETYVKNLERVSLTRSRAAKIGAGAAGGGIVWETLHHWGVL